MEMPENMKMLSREEHTALHKRTLTFKQQLRIEKVREIYEGMLVDDEHQLALAEAVEALGNQPKYEKALWNAVEDYEMEYGCMDDERKKEKINKWKHEAGLED